MKKVESVLDPVDMAHKEIISQDQEQTRSRAGIELAILPEAAQKEIAESCIYSSYFPNPITKPFMRKYILAKLEFPTKGSELAQSITELNVRIDNLFTDAFSYKKTELEAEKLDIEMAILQRDMAAQKDELIASQIDVEVRLKALEVANKKHSLNKIKLTAMSRFNEAKGWKGCVEDILAEMGKKSVDEVDFNQTRMDEMAAKIEKWGELAAKNQLEMTPSKFQAIESNKEAFDSGLNKAPVKQISQADVMRALEFLESQERR